MTHEDEYPLDLINQIQTLIDEHELFCVDLEWDPVKSEDYIFVDIGIPLLYAHTTLKLFTDALPVSSAWITHRGIEFRIDARPDGGYHD